jgi:DNA-directed RNA polymerase specialized sigma24 family protein
VPGHETEEFERFVGAVEPRLRVALMASFGPERGREATAEALAWAWENWRKARALEFPVAYLHRVGRSRTRGRQQGIPESQGSTSADPRHVEPGLPAALRGLSRRQREAVVLVHAYGWTNVEAAQVMEVAESSVKTHVRRGLSKLRADLEVASDV